MMETKDIFEDMRAAAGCTYISDLPKLSHHSLRLSVERLRSTDYSANQWAELFYYLTGQTGRKAEPEEEKASLLQQLEPKNGNH